MPLNGQRNKPLVRLGESTDDCWQWIGSINKRTGYGKKQWHGRSELAHRWVWEMFFGPIPVGKVINHKCSNRSCVNPAHLEIVTQTENCRHGRGTKLNARYVRAIRAFPTRHQSDARKLAEEYGVSASTIKDIWNNKSWKEIQA